MCQCKVIVGCTFLFRMLVYMYMNSDRVFYVFSYIHLIVYAKQHTLHPTLHKTLHRAMKRDVTRGGRRTNRGALDDAVAGARRFFMNNVRDTHRQLGVDVLLGLGEYSVLCGGNSSRSGGEKKPLLHQYAPLSYRLAQIRRVLSSSVLNPPITSTTASAAPTTTADRFPMGARNTGITRLLVPTAKSKRVRLVKRTPAVTLTLDSKIKTDSYSNHTTDANATTVGTSANEKILGVLSRKLDALFEDWLREIPQQKSRNDSNTTTVTACKGRNVARKVVKQDGKSPK